MITPAVILQAVALLVMLHVAIFCPFRTTGVLPGDESSFGLDDDGDFGPCTIDLQLMASVPRIPIVTLDLDKASIQLEEPREGQTNWNTCESIFVARTHSVF